MLLAAPAGRQGVSGDEPQPWVGVRDLTHDLRRAIRAAVVEDHEFHVDAFARQHVGAEPADRGLLVAGRHEHRDARPRPASLPRRSRRRGE
jgi:hypothetical protein